MKRSYIYKASVEASGFLLAVAMIAVTKASIYLFLIHAGLQYLTRRKPQ